MAERRPRGSSDSSDGKPLPLNSRRVTAPVLRQIAGALQLPDASSLDEVRQMIDGKLVEMGRKPKSTQVVIRDWVLVRFPQDETGKLRKLSRPWHGPYRIVSRDDPDVSVSKVYFPQEGSIQVHQSRVCPCPPEFPAGYFWYGPKRHSPGRPPKWTQSLLQRGELTKEQVVQQEVVVEADLNDEDIDQHVQYPSIDSGEASDCSDENSMEMEKEVQVSETQKTYLRDEGGRYSLRRRIREPDRLMILRSGRASSKGGSV